MRQGDGSDLLGQGDPRNKDIGILYVESTDSRQDILTAIKTQELQGRKQIAIVLPEQGKAFRQPVDFDGLKNMRRELKAQLIFVTPPGPGPADFARQRRFPVYSSVDTFKTALVNDGIPAPSSRVKTNPGSAKSKRQGILGFGAQKSQSGPGKSQGKPTALPPMPPTPRTQNDFPTTTPPTSRPDSEAVPPTPRIEELDTVEIDPSSQGKSGGSALPAAAAGMGMGLAAASALDDDDELAPPPATPRQPQGGPVAPIAQGSATPSGPAVGPMRAEPPAKTPPESRPAPGIIAFPASAPTPPKTPKASGKLAPQSTQKGRGSGKLARSDRSTAKLAPQGAQDAPVRDNQPNGRNGGTGKTAAVAAGAALGAAAVAGGAGARAASGGPSAATANATTAVASGTGGAGPTPRPSGLTPLPPPYSRRARRTRGRRILLAVLGILTLLLIASIVVEARGGFSKLIPGGLTATVTITPKSQVVQNNYLISAMPTGTPDPNQRQVAARFLTPESGTASGTANATGSIQAKRATGQLIFFNSTRNGLTIASNTVLTGADGVQVTFDGNVFVPATGSASTTKNAYAVQAGSKGNIAALDIAGPCCTPGISVKNTSAFSGGQDAQSNSVIQQADIDGAANPLVNSLSQSAQSALQKQVKSTEKVVDGSFTCQKTINHDHNVGDVAKSVKVTVTVKCNEEVYDFATARTMVTNLLQTHAQSDATLTGYKLVGQIVTTPLSDTVVSKEGQVNIEMNAQGKWVYQFTDQMLQNIKQALVRHTKAEAQSILAHNPGVATASIEISSGSVMPPNASDITLKVLPVQGVQNTPTGPGSTPTVSGGSPGITPTIGLGGS